MEHHGLIPVINPFRMEISRSYNSDKRTSGHSEARREPTNAMKQRNHPNNGPTNKRARLSSIFKSTQMRLRSRTPSSRDNHLRSTVPGVGNDIGPGSITVSAEELDPYLYATLLLEASARRNTTATGAVPVAERRETNLLLCPDQTGNYRNSQRYSSLDTLTEADEAALASCDGRETTLLPPSVPPNNPGPNNVSPARGPGSKRLLGRHEWLGADFVEYESLDAASIVIMNSQRK